MDSRRMTHTFILGIFEGKYRLKGNVYEHKAYFYIKDGRQKLYSPNTLSAS